jgi:hypothetical protein
MAKSTPNQLDRSRPSSRLQPQPLLETTPVLFRLPTVEVHPLPAVGELPTAVFQQVKVDVPTPTVAEPVMPPASIESQPVVAADVKQSWWEHWSSGIVLVVLLVAMYITSVAVLKSRSYKPASTLAEENSELNDLTSIDLPQIQTTTSTAGEPTESQVTQLTLPQLTLDNGGDSKVRVEELVGSLSNTLELSTGQSNDSKAAEDFGKADQSLSSVANEPLATAQLLEPTQMPHALPLLPSASKNLGSGDVPAQSVSSQVGQSPTLYDGATNTVNSNSGLPVTQVGGLTGLQSAELGSMPLPALTLNNPQTPVQSNNAQSGSEMPAYSQGYLQPTVSGATIPNLVTGVTQQPPTTATIGSQSNGASTGSGSGAATPRLTTTPDANGDAEAIIKAYLELMQAGQATQSAQQPTTTTSANRYAPTR